MKDETLKESTITRELHNLDKRLSEIKDINIVHSYKTDHGDKNNLSTISR